MASLYRITIHDNRPTISSSSKAIVVSLRSSQTLEESQLPIRRGGDMIVKVAMKKLKFVVEKHRDGYVAYPLGLKGAVVGQGESYESALADAKSAAAFHIESFGKEAFDDQDDVMEAFVTEASLTAG